MHVVYARACIFVCICLRVKAQLDVCEGARVLPPTAVCCSVCCSVLQYVAVCCSVLQRVAVWCSALQCVVVCFICSMLCARRCSCPTSDYLYPNPPLLLVKDVYRCDTSHMTHMIVT